MDLNISNTSSTDPDWRKIEKNMKKVGLKNGLSDGRDKNFQRSFDKGYEDGFRNSFILGDLKFQSEQKEKLETTKFFEDAKHGMCIVCTTEKDNVDVANVRKKQETLVNLHIEQIRTDLGIDALQI